MTVEELYNKIKDMELEDECRDFGGLIDIRFAGGQGGGVRKIRLVSNKIMLSGEFDYHTANTNLSFDEVVEQLKEYAESPDTYDYEVVYSVPSMGTYKVEDAGKHHYDYSWDGDGVYDVCEIYCGKDPINGGTVDDLKKVINPDEYEDFFERLLAEDKKPVNETIDGKYAAACYRAERVLASFYKDFGKEMTKMAFEHELDDIDF